MDEDGQHDPAEIAQLIDTAVESHSLLVYAAPVNPAPHGWFRNGLSNLTKYVFSGFWKPGFWEVCELSVSRW